MISGSQTDPEMQARLAAFRQGLENLGWSEGRNVHLNIRFADSRPDQYQRLAEELLAEKPDAIFGQTTTIVQAFQHQTSTVPIVFVSVSDPIGSGIVASLSRPGGNITGLMLYEEGITGKWLALLKEIAPGLTRIALMANPKTLPYDYFLKSGRAAASRLSVDLVSTPVETAVDVQAAIDSLARLPNSGLVVLPSGIGILHRDLIIALTAQHRIPTVYPFRFFVSAGGLMSYGTDVISQDREAATYISRILRGASPADLPVQAPTKYETVVNKKIAKAIGLEVPPSLLVRADEVIE